MDDMQAQPDEASSTLWRRWPRNPRIQADDEASIDLEMGTTVFRLPDLPTEIITNVFECLVPGPLPTGTGLPLSTDILTSRRALINLRLTSKFCNEIALPLMYRNIIITSRMQMADLLVNLITHQDRCAWMRSLAVLADLTFQAPSVRDDRAILTRLRRPLETNKISNQAEVLTKAIAKVQWQIYQLYDEVPCPLRNGAPLIHHGWRIRWFYYRLLRAILYLGIRIEDILITAPYSSQSHHLWHHRKVSREDLDAMTSSTIPPPSFAEAAFGDTFKSLRRIRTQSDPRKRLRFEPLPVMLEFLKCQRWELCRDNGNWVSLLQHGPGAAVRNQPSRYLEIFAHVTELRLYNSRTHPAWLRRCLRYAKNLKILCYTTRATEWNHEFANSALTSGEMDATLQEALEEVRETLTDLRLGWTHSGADLTEQDRVAMAPHRVDVSRFPRLKSVDIDPPFVFCDNEDEEMDGGGNDDTYLWF
ncbi:hypothetical protein FJTKL_15352 [Diaporthe vaccinii]|uniref:F-box domain-containing protein n=1 Tax=Diaporthe vaccinii TaxID=105482 RepID=A0ABR4E5A2_9PEZI